MVRGPVRGESDLTHEEDALMIIAGDVGGTKARVGLFERRAEKVELVVSEQYTSSEFSNLESIIHRFLEQHHAAVSSRLEAACFGVPGPVVNGRVKVTNLPWEVVQSEISHSLKVHKVKLVNDLVSTAAAIPNFSPSSLQTIYEGAGDVDRAGSCVVVAPGTGLGHSLIHREAGWSVLLASEGGHANFAPTNDLEIELLKYLQRKLPHVSVESILCGPGLVNIYSFLIDSGRGSEPSEMKETKGAVDQAALITKLALQGTSDVCVTALDMFCSMLGAHCSNIVLTYLATGGVFLGGGIPPKIIDTLAKGAFVEGYLKKGKQRERVEATPVFVVKDDYAALYGAAAIAATL
jgi:glucokinase